MKSGTWVCFLGERFPKGFRERFWERCCLGPFIGPRWPDGPWGISLMSWVSGLMGFFRRRVGGLANPASGGPERHLAATSGDGGGVDPVEAKDPLAWLPEFRRGMVLDRFRNVGRDWVLVEAFSADSDEDAEQWERTAKELGFLSHRHRHTWDHTDDEMTFVYVFKYEHVRDLVLWVHCGMDSADGVKRWVRQKLDGSTDAGIDAWGRFFHDSHSLLRHGKPYPPLVPFGQHGDRVDR